MFASTKDNKINLDQNSMVNEGAPLSDGAIESARHFQESTRDAASAIKHDIEAAAQRTSHHVRDLASSAQHNLSDVSGDFIAKIQRRPVRASLIALGAGFIIGMLYKR